MKQFVVTIGRQPGRGGKEVAVGIDAALEGKSIDDMVPQDLVDYVVVHELAHIRYKNHSSAFWQEVKKYMPDCLARRVWLQKHAVLLEIF